MKYKVGDKVRIKSIDWYNENKDKWGVVLLGLDIKFYPNMTKCCGKVLTIKHALNGVYITEEFDAFNWTDEMIEGLVEEENINNKWTGLKVELELSKSIIGVSSVVSLYGERIMSGFVKAIIPPEGYIFKDENGNEILTDKIILEKANTLKIQSDNMETETHRGYYTTEEETTNKSKKVAWLTFGDNDFADKIELDLSNRELIQEDGKWFVVKKKSKYPKTYEECCEILGCVADYVWGGYKQDLFQTFHMLYICRDAYWKIAGEEMGLSGSWEPDWDDTETKYCIANSRVGIKKCNTYDFTRILAFPTEEMRDAFFENFKKDIEKCKELL